MNIVIVTAIGGWQFVGILSDITESHIELAKARVIVRWGTKDSLGQLANGPTDDTVHKPIGRIRLPMTSVVFFIQDIEGWTL